MGDKTSERSGGRERGEQSGASERVSGASERANGRASGPVLTSLFLVVPDHSALAVTPTKEESLESVGAKRLVDRGFASEYEAEKERVITRPAESDEDEEPANEPASRNKNGVSKQPNDPRGRGAG